MAKPTKQEIQNFIYEKDGVVWCHIPSEGLNHDTPLEMDLIGEPWYTIYEVGDSPQPSQMKVIFMWM
jgi:hypothetical protein